MYIFVDSFDISQKITYIFYHIIMKKITIISLSLISLFLAQACKSQQPTPPEGMPKGLHDSVSMAVGLYLSQIIEYNIQMPEVNYDIVFKTMKKVRDGKDIGIDQMQIGEIAQKYAMKKQELVSEKNQIEGIDFLAKNKTLEGVSETESGLQYKLIEEGTGITPEIGDIVTVHYTGTLIDGTQFDSSLDREPITMPLTPGNLIQGWIEGFQLLKEGSKAMLFIPSELGYGIQGNGPIPPNATIIFDVNLIRVEKAESQPEQ